jgi:dipeptidyl aminopeptidase/acylaminoacyl peptidase
VFSESRWKKIALSLFVVIIAIYFGLSGYMASNLTQIDREPLNTTPESKGLAYEDISFPSYEDSLQLKGWFIPSPASRRVILLVHGKSYHRANPDIGMLDVAEALVRNGFNIFTFDLRGYGESEGKRFSLGYYEQRDLKGAVGYILSRGYRTDQIGVIGWSMGGATTMVTAGTTPEIKAIVIDSGYADLVDILDVQIPRESGLPPIFTFGILSMARVLHGINLYSIKPVDSVSRLEDRHIFIIHGEADSLVPVEHARRIFSVIEDQPGNEIWLLPGVGHVDAYQSAPDEYIRRVVAFFDRELQ